MIYEFMFVAKLASLICLGRRVNSSNSCCMQLHFIRAVITFEAVCLFLAEGMKYKRGAFQWGGREFGTVNYLVTLYSICLWSYKNAIVDHTCILFESFYKLTHEKKSQYRL